MEAVDGLSVPAVYNGDWDHFVGKHIDLFTTVGRKPAETLASSVPLVGGLVESKGIEKVAELTDSLFGEGYVVQHLESAAADRAGVETTYTPEEVAGAALATESFYGFPVFYIEYSGTYGGPEDVEQPRTISRRRRCSTAAASTAPQKRGNPRGWRGRNRRRRLFPRRSGAVPRDNSR